MGRSPYSALHRQARAHSQAEARNGNDRGTSSSGRPNVSWKLRECVASWRRTMAKRESGVSAEGILKDAARDIWRAVIMAPGDRDHQYAADEVEAISRLGGINTDIGQGIIARAKQEAWG